MEEEQRKEKNKMSWREFFSMGEFWGYFFRRKDPSRPSNFNIRAMHGVNKFSIGIFIIAVIYLLLRRLF
jgi:uncharacterized protein DUF6728